MVGQRVGSGQPEVTAQAELLLRQKELLINICEGGHGGREGILARPRGPVHDESRGW